MKNKVVKQRIIKTFALVPTTCRWSAGVKWFKTCYIHQYHTPFGWENGRWVSKDEYTYYKDTNKIIGRTF